MNATKNLKLPDSWDGVTVAQFQEIMQLQETSSKTDEIISILADEDIEIIKHMSPESRDKVITALTWVIKYPDNKNYHSNLVIDNVEYDLIDLNDITVAEWIDLTDAVKNSDANMHIIFSYLYRPKSGKVEKGADEIFKYKVSIGEVYGSLFFLSNTARESMNSIPNYLTDILLQRMKNLDLNLKQKGKNS